MDMIAQPVPPMPKEIASAIVLVMKAVGRLANDAKNQHGNYGYVSASAFLAAINPACAEAGLIIAPMEMGNSMETIEVSGRDGKPSLRRMVRMTFGFVLIHESGTTWSNPRDTRTVMVDHTGAQSYGSAQSYALKQYMRALFMVATGDPDADQSEQHQADLIRATVKANKAKVDTGDEQILLDFGNGLETLAAKDVAARVMSHIIGLGDRGEAAEWWVGQRHGREQYHNQFPKLAHDLKKKVEGYLTANAQAAE